MFFSSYIMFFSLVLLTILFSLGSTSMFMIWVMLEINMMSVLPLLSSKGGAAEGDVALKYFISQSVASILFIFLLSLLGQESVYYELLFLAILFKLGLAPFHGWMTSIFMSSNYHNLFIIGTVQKIIPLHLLSLFFPHSSLIYLIFSLNMILMLSLMWSQASIRLILLLSSITNSIWMLSVVNISTEWLSFMLVYSSMNFSLIYFFSYLNISSLSQLNLLSSPLKIILSLITASLAGLPPFLGFIQKLLILKALLLNMEFMLMMILILFSLMILWVYLSMILPLYALGENSSSKSSSYKLSLFISLTLFLVPGSILL